MSETMLQNPPALGRLIGVSLGPGDPGLITRAAWAQLQRTDAVWTYPARSTKTPSYAFDIVQRAGLAPPVACPWRSRTTPLPSCPPPTA